MDLEAGEFPNEVLAVIRSRRSTRAFSGEAPSPKELGLILDAGLWAPSGHNQQPWRLSVLRSRADIERLNRSAVSVMSTLPVDWIAKAAGRPGFDISYGAPVLVLVFSVKDALAPELDCGAALQNMALAAESLGLGSLWLGFARFAFMDPDFQAWARESGVEWPECGLQCAMALGRKAPGAPRKGPERKADIVRYF